MTDDGVLHGCAPSPPRPPCKHPAPRPCLPPPAAAPCWACCPACGCASPEMPPACCTPLPACWRRWCLALRPRESRGQTRSTACGWARRARGAACSAGRPLEMRRRRRAAGGGSWHCAPPSLLPVRGGEGREGREGEIANGPQAGGPCGAGTPACSHVLRRSRPARPAPPPPRPCTAGAVACWHEAPPSADACLTFCPASKAPTWGPGTGAFTLHFPSGEQAARPAATARRRPPALSLRPWQRPTSIHPWRPLICLSPQTPPPCNPQRTIAKLICWPRRTATSL